MIPESCTQLYTTRSRTRTKKAPCKPSKLGDNWQSVNFPPPSLSCFTAEGLVLPQVSISSRVKWVPWAHLPVYSCVWKILFHGTYD